MEAAEFDLKAVLAILKRQRRLLLSTIVAAAGLALAYILLATPTYTATVLLQLDGRGANVLDPSAVTQEQGAILNARVDSEVEILRSDATALAVLERAGLVRDPEFGPRLGWLDKLGLALGMNLDGDGLRRLVGLQPTPPETPEDLANATLLRLKDAVDIRRRGLTYLIAISATSAAPRSAADIANTYAAVYIDRQVAAKTQATITARDVLRRQIDTARQELATSETAINDFIETNLARLESESGDPAVQRLRDRLTETKQAQASARSRIASAESALAARDWTTLATGLGDQALQELAQQRAALQARLGATDGAEDAAVDLRSEIAALDRDLATRSDAALQLLRDDAGTLSQRESEARDQLRTVLLDSDLSAETLTDLFNLQQRATVARDQYQALLAREQDLGALANLQIADARIVSEALPPTSASAPRRNLILALALFAGIGLGTTLAFLKEFYVGGIVSASQLSNVLQAPVPVTLALLDEVRQGQDPADIVVSAPMSPHAEAFRKLRAAIDVGLPERGKGETGATPPGRVILVCSALPAEGKSTVAIALARTYAMAGIETLLIDADLRKPTVGPRLRLTDNPGLISFINDAIGGRDARIEPAYDPSTSAVILPAGPRSALPTDQLFLGKSFKSVIETAIRSFDVVILDSPPLLPVVDTRYLARHADAILHVVRYGTTTQGEVREAAQQLREHLPAGRHYLGMLNLEERVPGEYSYYGRYGYYGSDPD